MSSSRDVSVIICAYTLDRWDLLNASVAGVKRLTVPPGEIIVVVDHNSALFERARAEISGITVIENTQSPGLSGARNSGVLAAQGSLVAFLDEDAAPAPDWLEWLLKGYEDPDVLGVGGIVEPVWESGRPGWFPGEFNWVVGCSYRGLPTEPGAVRNLIGCNMSFRRDVFKVVGGFKSMLGRKANLPLSCEETEFCIRAAQHMPGRSFRFEPRARVFHMVSASRTGVGYFLSRCYYEGSSKALVARSVGAGDGLSSERAFLLRTMPQAIAREVALLFRAGDLAGLSRAGAIATGLGAALVGFAAASMPQRRPGPPEPQGAEATQTTT